MFVPRTTRRDRAVSEGVEEVGAGGDLRTRSGGALEEADLEAELADVEAGGEDRASSMELG